MCGLIINGTFHLLKNCVWVVVIDLTSFHSPVALFGTNLLGHADNITRVEFGDIEAVVDYDSLNDSQVSVRVQANDVVTNTPVQVVITAATMARVESSGNDWTYLVPGRIVNVQPNIGQFGTRVTITGMRCMCVHVYDSVSVCVYVHM